MLRFFFIFTTLSCPVYSLASTAVTENQKFLQMVPGGKIIEQEYKEVKIQSSEGTVVELEFDKSGEVDEISGDFVERDSFLPPNNLLPLKDVLAMLKNQNKKPIGEWSLEKKKSGKWVYEFEGYEEGLKFEYKVDAATGSILSANPD